MCSSGDEAINSSIFFKSCFKSLPLAQEIEGGCAGIHFQTKYKLESTNRVISYYMNCGDLYLCWVFTNKGTMGDRLETAPAPALDLFPYQSLSWEQLLQPTKYIRNDLRYSLDILLESWVTAILLIRQFHCICNSTTRLSWKQSPHEQWRDECNDQPPCSPQRGDKCCILSDTFYQTIGIHNQYAKPK